MGKKGIQMTIEEERNKLEKLIKQISNTKEPQGSLRIRKIHNAIQYSNRIGNKEVYLSRNDLSLIKALAQKPYNLKVQEAAKHELEIINTCIEQRNEQAIAELYDSLSSEIKEFVTPFEISDKEYTKQWLEKTYVSKVIDEGTKFIITSNGDKVRSKSESIIADKLYSKKIPYRYEQKHILHEQFNYRQIVLYPDFTILNPHTREEVIWEHFGLMSNEEYADNAVGKISLYNQNNYIQGKNLICTFESKSTPLQPYEIENIIKTFLL